MILMLMKKNSQVDKINGKAKYVYNTRQSSRKFYIFLKTIVKFLPSFYVKELKRTRRK